MPTFVERVQALPVELYDEVFALTFTPDLIITVDDSYKPPTTLQVSRATRAKFKTSYFGYETIFYVTKAVIQKWLKSLLDMKVGIESEIRVTGLVIRAASLTRCQLSDRAEDAFTIDVWPDEIGDECASEITNGLSLQVAFGEPEKTAWIPYQYLEETSHVCTRFGHSSATKWCEEHFGKDAMSANELAA